MTMMFSECSALESLNIADWNVSSLIHLRATFYSCKALASLDISAWRPVNLEDLESAFELCSVINGLDFSQWRCPSIKGKMNRAFYQCLVLTSLDLSGFGPGKVTSFQNTFSGSGKLQVIDMSGFDTSNTTDFQNTFRKCGNLTVIYVGEAFSTVSVNVTSNLPFNSNAKLVGGNGTEFNDSKCGYEYLCVDEPGHPGYLTLKK